MMAKNILEEECLHLVVLKKLRIWDPDLFQPPSQIVELKEECKLFVDKIAVFWDLSQLAKATEKEKFKTNEAHNLMKSIKNTHLETYQTDYQTQRKAEADQH
uniref:Uncharacterized protein n=1 Tax=Salvator merianae TaxID=96440 RepID=A0A8D0BZD4_SALMN